MAAIFMFDHVTQKWIGTRIDDDDIYKSYEAVRELGADSAIIPFEPLIAALKKAKLL